MRHPLLLSEAIYKARLGGVRDFSSFSLPFISYFNFRLGKVAADHFMKSENCDRKRFEEAERTVSYRGKREAFAVRGDNISL
ncbi:hypothetical protein NPIL_115241 [Nephila pilipes]|uniref:Uncharacterized protein n=1 Tax=Nephila pilipes TaxID=299642 RepID=A0A8X6PAZ6_NEPPI|nr:hypothetical protein NPIL_115241 [Nephila pilipes]